MSVGLRGRGLRVGLYARPRTRSAFEQIGKHAQTVGVLAGTREPQLRILQLGGSGEILGGAPHAREDLRPTAPGPPAPGPPTGVLSVPSSRKAPAPSFWSLPARVPSTPPTPPSGGPSTWGGPAPSFRGPPGGPSAPTARLSPPARTTASQKRRPSSYWRIFSSRPSSRSSTPPRQPAVLAAAGHRGAQARQRGQHLGADGVHHVLGVALDERHRRLQPLHQLPALLAERQAHQFPVAQALGERAGVAGARGAAAARSERTPSPAGPRSTPAGSPRGARAATARRRTGRRG